MKCLRNEHGFTLMEVMVAFLILLLASQLLIFGSAVARKMEKRANEISAATDFVQEKLSDESECVAGTLRLKLDEETELTGSGWLYQYEENTENGIMIHVVRLDHEGDDDR